MKEFKGTPGNWSVMMDDDEIKIIQSKSLEKGPIWKTYVAICEEVQCREDANLIAAAPDLLQALQTIQAKMSDFIKLANEVGINDADGFYLAAATGAEEQARAAISKALGEG